jgi:hypothetical protein
MSTTKAHWPTPQELGSLQERLSDVYDGEPFRSFDVIGGVVVLTGRKRQHCFTVYDVADFLTGLDEAGTADSALLDLARGLLDSLPIVRRPPA